MTTRKPKPAPRKRSRAVEWWTHLPKVAQVTSILIAVASGLLGAVLWVKTELVFAGDLKRVETLVTRSVLQNEKSVMELRRDSLADKIYELESKPKRTPAEQAVLTRYKADHDNVTRMIRDRGRRLDDAVIVK